MQTLTFTPKVLRQRRFLSFLLPLFAIFVGMGSALNVQAATVLSNSTVQISRNGGATETFNVSNPNTPKPFDGTRLGTYDINSVTALVIKGGSITATTSGTSTATSAVLNYTVTDSLGNLVNTGSINLNTITTSGSARTFSNTTSNVNVLAGITTSGSGYTLSLDYLVRGTNPLQIRDDNSGAGYNAFFNVSGTLTPPPTVTARTITFDPNGVPPSTPTNPNPANRLETYNINPPAPNPFQNANLSASATGGAYDVNTGQLLLNGTSVTTTQAGGNNITSVVLYYRTRAVNGPGGAFQPINLTETGGSTGGTKTFVLDPAQGGNGLSQPNLIATPAVTQAGTYVLEVYYQANGFNSATNTSITITDPPTPNTYYSANFTVSGNLIAQTIWTGGFNDNWFDSRNWSAGVPDESTNALVRDLGTGNSVPYPNINSDANKTTAAGAILYSNLGSGPAKARNLILGGTSQASRSICRLEQGQLQVFGDFSNRQDSFIQRENTIMEFAGVNVQSISGGSFFRVDISGGGVKNLTGVMNVSASLNFLTGVSTGSEPAAVNPYTAPAVNAGILATNISDPNVSVVVLADRSLLNGNNGAQLTGETDDSFLFGFVRTTRQAVLAGETRTYGNLGMTITFNGTNNPGNVDVTRNTVEAYAPAVGAGRFGIRRIFGVRPSDPNTTTGGLTATIVFRYRDSETRNLNGPTTTQPGSGVIQEQDLTIFLSSNSGNSFSLIGRDAVDTFNNTVTKTGVTNFATFTLGDQNRPLPVRLTAFDANRLGTGALITWQTANELNSKGYEVQVSTNGTEFSTLTFVSSATANSARVTNYRYEDKATYNARTVYYRLRQIDLDGKDAYFGPRAVSFDGKTVAAGLVAYPNPYDSNDELHVAIKSNQAGKGQLLVTDMTGRTIHQESIELNNGLSDMPISGVKELKAGIYMVRVTLPSGETQTMKVVKQ